MSLVKDALADVGVSVEEFQTIPAEATIDTPVLAPVAAVDQPSVNIPLTEQPIVPEVTPAPIVQEDVPVTEILEEVPIVPTEAVIAEHEELQAKADQLVALQTAMERYHTIVRKAGFNGISNQTAEVLQVHMQIAQQQLGLTSKIGSMESFNAKSPREQHDLATISLEDIKSMAKGALDKFIAIVEKILEFIKRTGHNLLDGILHVERAVDKLDGQLSKIKVSGGEGTFQCAGTILKHGEEIDRAVSPDIHGLAQFASTSYPDAIVKFLDGMVKGVIKFDANGKGIEELDAFFAQYSKPLQFLIVQQADKDELPGGYTMDVSEHGLSIGVTYHDSKEPALGQTEELPVSSTAELRKLVRDIKALIIQLKDIRPETEKISQAGKKLIEAVKRSAAKADEETGGVYSEMTMKVGKMVQESSPRAGEIVDYIVRYIKGHCVAIDAQIKVITKAKSED